MKKTFDDYLAEVRGTVRQTNHLDIYERRKSVSTYYMNHANDFRTGALVIWATLHGDKLTPEDIGFGKGWSFGATLHPVFNLLSGLSIELLLKATAKILGRPERHHHRLSELCDEVGIGMTEDQIAILNALTEGIYWESRYPVPTTLRGWEAASKVRNNLWKEAPASLGKLKLYTPDPNRSLNLENYNQIWGAIFDLYWRAKEEIYED